MDIEYGTLVVDGDDKVLGTVDYVIRNSWTGEVSKFRVNQNQSGSEFMCSPENVVEKTETKIKVDVASHE
jgi:hypothetical protein